MGSHFYAVLVTSSLRVKLMPISVTASDWEKLANEANHYPRLRVAEESARSWYTGVMAFREDIRELIQAARDNSFCFFL